MGYWSSVAFGGTSVYHWRWKVKGNRNTVTVVLSHHGDNSDYKECGISWMFLMAPKTVNREKTSFLLKISNTQLRTRWKTHKVSLTGLLLLLSQDWYRLGPSLENYFNGCRIANPIKYANPSVSSTSYNKLRVLMEKKWDPQGRGQRLVQTRRRLRT